MKHLDDCDILGMFIGAVVAVAMIGAVLILAWAAR